MRIYRCPDCREECRSMDFGAPATCEDCGTATTYGRTWDGINMEAALCPTCAVAHSRMGDPYKHEPGCDGPDNGGAP